MIVYNIIAKLMFRLYMYTTRTQITSHHDHAIVQTCAVDIRTERSEFTTFGGHHRDLIRFTKFITQFQYIDIHNAESFWFLQHFNRYSFSGI